MVGLGDESGCDGEFASKLDANWPVSSMNGLLIALVVCNYNVMSSSSCFWHFTSKHAGHLRFVSSVGYRDCLCEFLPLAYLLLRYNTPEL